MKKVLFVSVPALLLILAGVRIHLLPEDERVAPRDGIASLACVAPSARPLEFFLSQPAVCPGDCIGLYVAHATEPDRFQASAPFYEKAITFFPYGDGFAGLIPVYAWLAPGDYLIGVRDVRANAETTLPVKVLPKTFDVQYLWVPESTASLLTDENTAKDQAFIDAARAHPIPRKLWNGPFVQPTEGVITTTYNSTRYTYGNPVPRRHLALDIGNAEGTPVTASNNGKVVLARKLIVSGNTVIIDHGMGIFTSSLHLSSIAVEEGAPVAKGDVIGRMGQTGYSVGPHLHFAVWKEGTFINPGFLFKTDPVSFDR
jgi:hypothetical protein